MDYPTLSRFFSLHFLLPFLILALVGVHIGYLHQRGSNNPVSLIRYGDKIIFSPYFIIKDLFGFILRFVVVLLYPLINPRLVIESQNFIHANCLVTPPHIQPEWYFLAAYAVLRSIPNKLGGVVALLMFVLIYYFLPFFSI